MYKFLFFICALFGMAIEGEAAFQSSVQSDSASQHQPTLDKESWQRLHLMLSSTFWHVVKEGQVDLNSSLLYASRSLGVSRLPVVAEGVDDPELIAQSKWIDQQAPRKGKQLLLASTGQQRVGMLVLLGAYYAFEPVPMYKSDSAEFFLLSAIKESHRWNQYKLGRQALCLLGKFFFHKHDTERGDSIFRLLTTACRVARDKKGEARAYEYWGLYSPFSPATTQSRIGHLRKAAELYQRVGLTEGQINSLADIGYLLVASGNLSAAYDVQLRALELAESIQFSYTHYTTHALATVTSFQGKFGEPLKYSLQSISVSKASRDSVGWAYFYAKLSSMYAMEGGKEQEAMIWSRKAVDRFLLDQNPASYGLLPGIAGQMSDDGKGQKALELVSTLFKKTPPSNFAEWFWYHLSLSMCYEGIGEFNLANKHLYKADSLETKSESFRGPLRRGAIYMQQGYIYKKQGRFLAARSAFEKYFATQSHRVRLLGNDIHTYRQLILLDSILHDDVASLKHYKRYAILIDSNYAVAKLRQAEELQVMYQTQEKEKQITLLNQRAEEERASLHQAKIIRNMTIAGIIAALVIVVLLFRQTTLRKKTNQVVTQKNEQLQHFLNEKEWLLKEIHHRVKNNLQIIMSLLNSQSAYIDNESARSAIHDSQHRVHAMSLIHQKLYNTENISSIEMSAYMRELGSYLADSFKTGQRIRLEFFVDSLEMDVSQAVPLGLILNEAITNAIKYAFPGDRGGRISISLSCTSSHHYLLMISDNGIGISSYFPGKKYASLGMSLMEGLSEDLDGHFSIENNGGTTIKVSFVYGVVK